MTYRIMIKTATGNKDQYQFLTFINVNGEVEIWETDNLVDLDKQVEKMLNGNYRKSDILLVSLLSFDVFADVYDNSKYPPEPTPEPEPTPDPEPTTEVDIKNVTRVISTDEETGDVTAVEFTATGDDLPENEEYTWNFTTPDTTVTKTSTGATLRVDDEDKDSVAVAVSVTVAVGNYTSPVITFE